MDKENSALNKAENLSASRIEKKERRKREKAPEGFGVFSVYSEEKIPLTFKAGTHNIRIEAAGRACIDYIRFIT